VGKIAVALPDKVEVTLAGDEIQVKGPLGVLAHKLPPQVRVEKHDRSLRVVATERSRRAVALWGTTRAVLANMVRGVSQGFEKRLTLVGVGYRAQAQGDKLNLSLGFSHPIVHAMPKGIKVETPSQTEIVIRGADRRLVGQVAAEVRGYRKPEPYKGKGVRYADEEVVRKETKKK
jgi:large subunit ribosomal protein L6